MNKVTADSFDITKFSWYKDIKGQYLESFIKSSRCVKIKETDSSVLIAVAEAARKNTEVLIKVHSPKTIKLEIVKDTDFAEFIGNFVDCKSFLEVNQTNEFSSFILEDINNDSPVVNIINAICLEAIRRKASDIHIQGTKTGLCVRLRIDGVLQTVRTFDKSFFDNLVSRIKVMAGLNVMENRLCQDGRMTVFTGGTNLDFRVSIIPSVSGQNIVLRLFNRETENLSLEDLGFSNENLKKINAAINIPYGMILVTGPTGSGKTTTLHSIINKMDKDHLKIVTIEDPVEKVIDGIEQIQVNDEINLTFENILRRVLRHDPDVIMVGEIRDKETAELAVRSALTGHTILSTLHTNDSISAITRLQNLGIEPYLIAGTVKSVIAQRLVRKTCKYCKGQGCQLCNSTGYNGRTAVGEVFLVDDKIIKIIEEGKPDFELRDYLVSGGFKTLKDDAKQKVKEKISTKAELQREGLI